MSEKDTNTEINPAGSIITFRSNFSVEFNEEDPWYGDRLNRKESAELLTKLLSSAETPFTLVVNSAWGTGKTFFIERWNASIRKNHFSFYFSAWEAEIHPMPMLAFLQGLQETFSKDKELSSATDEMTDLILKFVAFKVALPLALDSVIPGMGVGVAGANIVNLLIAEGKNFVKKKMDAAFKEPPRNVQSIRDSFKKIIEKICEESSKQEPIYIFIDELDRCRPDFAIRFLEEIKHLFCVPGIVFVLSLDLEQLNISIKHVYGQDIKSEGYLRRFVNQFYNLPPIPHDRFVEKLFAGFEHSKHQSIIDNQRDINKIFSNFANCFNPSLRDMEAIFAKYSALAKTSPNNSIFPVPFAYFLFVQTLLPELWRDSTLTGDFSRILPKNLMNENLIFNWPIAQNGFAPLEEIEIQLASYGERLSLEQVRNILPTPSHDNEKILFLRKKLKLVVEKYFEAFKSQISLIELHASSFG